MQCVLPLYDPRKGLFPRLNHDPRHTFLIKLLISGLPVVDWRNRWPCKYFSVFIQAGGSYRLTPFYDIISAFPVLGGTGIHISDLKLAMGLNASKGKKTAIDKIYPRHFLATAKVLKFPEVQMHEILSDFARMIPAALDNVKTSLPTDFPENVVTAVETNVLRLHGRLSREYGIK